MSMQPMPWPEPAPEVAAAIRAIYRGKRQVPLPVRVRDELGEVFADESFAGAFGREGRPGWSPGRLALITVLQRVENLTDRQAAEAVATDVTWKYALGLSLDDAGFDASVLSEFRSRLIAHELEEKPLDLLLSALQERGLLAAGGRQRTDSTPCTHERSRKPSTPPAPNRPPPPGATNTSSDAASRPPSTKPSPSPACAAPATAASRKSTSNTSSPPSPSTSSAWTPGGTATPGNGNAPATWPDSNQP
ncbi:hypothetical protein GCM10022419_114700 [Nonomuraea rosea]|uniref:Transposase InsH N-terminal domain-containing protein n=1 Tax=Nonomuraea rosea TaxID=638574 RepID=A0ABP6ZIE4_9ACTN